MSELILKKKKNNAILYQVGMIALMALFATALYSAAPMFAMAGGTGTGTGTGTTSTTTNATKDAQDVFGAILTVVYNIVRIVGAILLVIGVVKFVIAHANEQGPEQQKAAMMLATGLMLVILPTILKGLNLQNYITIDTTKQSFNSN